MNFGQIPDSGTLLVAAIMQHIYQVALSYIFTVIELYAFPGAQDNRSVNRKIPVSLNLYHLMVPVGKFLGVANTSKIP